MVKIANPDVWKVKKTIIWEAANGPIPKGYVVIFADRNKSNFDLDNLLLVSRKELMIMNRKSLIFPDQDLTKTGKAIAGLHMAINSKIKKRETKKEENS
jgi:hypothetical protein